MTRKPVLPPQLLRGPFTIDEARQVGLDKSQMRGASWVRVAPSMYMWRELQNDPIHRLEAARRRLPADFAFSGLTAAWLHGIDVEPCGPIEVTVGGEAGVSARSGLAIRRSCLPKDEVVTVRHMRATSIVRTVAELCCRLSLVDAIVVADAALHARRLRTGDLTAWAASHPGHRGVRRLRDVLLHAEPAAESPMESRLRMVLVLAGLPRPRAQVSIHDKWARFVGRPDLYYEEARLGIEYDGVGHREQLAEDNRRQNRLLNAGVRLLRFTGGDVLGKPESIAAQVRSALSEASTAGSGTSRRSTFRASAGTRT